MNRHAAHSLDEWRVMEVQGARGEPSSEPSLSRPGYTSIPVECWCRLYLRKVSKLDRLAREEWLRLMPAG
jgi:hypothetical protein